MLDSDTATRLQKDCICNRILFNGFKSTRNSSWLRVILKGTTIGNMPKHRKTQKNKKSVDKSTFWKYNKYCSDSENNICTSGSVVEYRLAKARVAGSNPVSCSFNNN